MIRCSIQCEDAGALRGAVPKPATGRHSQFLHDFKPHQELHFHHSCSHHNAPLLGADGENGLWSFVVPQQLTEMLCKNHDCDMCKSKRESHPVHLSRLYLSKEGLITEVQSMQKN